MSSKNSQIQLAGLQPEKMPAHVAFIMDGNGRWAKQRIMNRVKGHEKGAGTVRTVVSACRELEIPYLTLYAFSTENWARPKLEVSALMTLLKSFLVDERQNMLDNNIRLHAIGQLDRLPEKVARELKTTMALTAENTGLHLSLALSYGGRNELTEMVRSIARKAKDSEIDLQDISEEMISNHLYTAGIPDPDLVVRTSGEMRLSNFLLWQIAYSEIYFANTLWPDFSKEEFVEILKNYQNRDRRFGEVTE